MKLAVFDLDGTLINTLPDITKSLNRALATEGFAPYAEADVAGMVGRSVVYMIERATPGADAETRERVRKTYFVDYGRHSADSSYPYEGMYEALCGLRKEGFSLAVVTNKPHAHAVRLLERLFPHNAELFCQVQGQSHKFKTKPAPDSLYFVLNLQGAGPGEAIYVGDSEVDLEFAKNAGLPCIACAWGFVGGEKLKEAGAGHLIEHPAQIVDSAKGLLGETA